jgi:hypothetical protein
MRIDLDDIRSSQAGLDSCGVYTSGNSLINEADSADRPEDTGCFRIPVLILSARMDLSPPVDCILTRAVTTPTQHHSPSSKIKRRSIFLFSVCAVCPEPRTR